MHVIPGGRIAGATRRQAVVLAGAASWFFGPEAWRISRAAANRPKLHRLEHRWGRRVARFLDIQWDVAGLEQVEAGRRTIVLPLHEGFADALALLRLGLDLRFVARDELFEWPVLGRYLRHSDQVLIDTARGRAAYRHLLEAGGRALDAGDSLVVFPQGSILGIEVAFWPGAFRLAERLEAWVLPVAITGTHRVWEYPYSPLVRFGQPVSVRVLPAVPPDRAVAEAAGIETRLKDLALDGSMAEPRRYRPERDGYWDDYRFEIDRRFPDLAASIAQHRAAGRRPA